MKITRRSPRTGELNTREIDITQEQLDEISKPLPNRRIIQEIVPNLEASDREFLITGYTDEDWDEMFPPEKE